MKKHSNCVTRYSPAKTQTLNGASILRTFNSNESRHEKEMLESLCGEKLKSSVAASKKLLLSNKIYSY